MVNQVILVLKKLPGTKRCYILIYIPYQKQVQFYMASIWKPTQTYTIKNKTKCIALYRSKKKYFLTKYSCSNK